MDAGVERIDGLHHEDLRRLGAGERVGDDHVELGRTALDRRREGIVSAEKLAAGRSLMA